MEYDANKRKIKKYVAIDSMQYFIKLDMKSDFSVSKSCVYCEEKYLNQEWKYKENKLVEWNSYTYKKEKHTKRNYFYDKNAKLIKIIDSTGWYFKEIKPFLESITEINYDENGKTITEYNNQETLFPKFYYKTIKQYNKDNYLIKIERFSQNQIDTFEYIYDNNLLVSESAKFGEKNTSKQEYFYNKKGLLAIKKDFYNSILIRIEKYYFE